MFPLTPGPFKGFARKGASMDFPNGAPELLAAE
jgi:hypothetical protein